MTVYATAAQIKAALRITDTVDDTLITMAANAASELIDGYCGRSFGTTGTVVRYFAPTEGYVLQVDDLAGTALTLQSSSSADGVYDVTFTAADYQLEPLNAVSEGLSWPYTRIRAVGAYNFVTAGGEVTVKLTALYGWAGVPASVTQAAVIQGSRIFTRLQSPLGVAGFGEMGVVRVSRALDPDVAQLVEPFRRYRSVA